MKLTFAEIELVMLKSITTASFSGAPMGSGTWNNQEFLLLPAWEKDGYVETKSPHWPKSQWGRIEIFPHQGGEITIINGRVTRGQNLVRKILAR